MSEQQASYDQQPIENELKEVRHNNRELALSLSRNILKIAELERELAGYKATIEEMGRPYPKVMAMLETREEGKRIVLEQQVKELGKQLAGARHHNERYREDIAKLEGEITRLIAAQGEGVELVGQLSKELAESKEREEADSDQIAGLLRDLEGVPRMAELQQQLAEAQAQCAVMRKLISQYFHEEGECTCGWCVAARKALASDAGRQFLADKQAAEARVAELEGQSGYQNRLRAEAAEQRVKELEKQLAVEGEVEERHIDITCSQYERAERAEQRVKELEQTEKTWLDRWDYYVQALHKAMPTRVLTFNYEHPESAGYYVEVLAKERDDAEAKVKELERELDQQPSLNIAATVELCQRAKQAQAKVKELSGVLAAARRLGKYHREFVEMPREAYLAALGLLDALAEQEDSQSE